jgi:hypothetical protein
MDLGGREDNEDDLKIVRPTECRNDNVENISQLSLQNRHLSLRMLADEVNIGKDTVRTKSDVLDRACVNPVTGSFCTITPRPTTRQSSRSFWPNEK